MSTETIERVEEIEFFNVNQPGIKIFVSQDPDYDKLPNKALANDKYVHFQAGLFRTSDPELIEFLNREDIRQKYGIRCKANPADMAEFGSHKDRMTWMEAEIERRVQEEVEARMAELTHATISPFEATPAQAAESAPPAEGDE